jgi:hypothetical protein
MYQLSKNLHLRVGLLMCTLQNKLFSNMTALCALVSTIQPANLRCKPNLTQQEKVGFITQIVVTLV